MTPRLTFVAWVAATMVMAGPAYAQSPRGSADPDRFGIRAYATCDSLHPAATKSFDAVFGSTTLTACGGGAEAVNLWKQLFVRVAGSKAHATGQRVFVFDGTAFKLGTRLTMSMAPLELGAGWRFGTRWTNRFVPYVGAGALWLDYRESSDFATSEENVSKRYTGSTVFAGIDVAVVRFLSIGTEVQYRQVKIPGLAGAAAEFKEENLGGGAFRVTIGFRY